MAKERFFYLPQPLADEQQGFAAPVVRRPLLLAEVSAPNGLSTRAIVIPDSGSDTCMLPLALAHKLELDLAALPSTLTTGVGSTANLTYYSDLHINIGRGMSFVAKVGFSHGVDAIGFGLLGQSGFFDQFNVEFRLSEGIFIIEPAQTAAIH